ncbi:predicted protein [Sclerotinia sclerotiorum 1980 UF-70]|uniref:Uncharacterized protein n=1 Tax=Sclerotinia sclerotiorum (strain ATCC 18683 / 1980 / Ss-1) TaxID=665079 RepID=A7E8A3_SCLS1|nr:predicted protein [Sclerotinia sclerotiorum 1980 UF-70]EDN96605.1 predicted protein [Sclerotinia sclerotiorum 1980 UF-70]
MDTHELISRNSQQAEVEQHGHRINSKLPDFHPDLDRKERKLTECCCEYD